MKFISARRLAVFFSLVYSGIDEALLKNLQKSTQQHFAKHETLQFLQQDFTFQEVTFILKQLETEENRVFHSWIEEDKKLVNYLFTNDLTIVTKSTLLIPTEHPMFAAYQTFLSPYLSPILTEKVADCIKEEDFSRLQEHLNFSPLLPEKERITLQKPVAKYLNQYLQQISMSKKEDLQHQLQHIYALDFAAVLTTLDEYFYNELVTYFETAKRIIENNELNALTLDKIKTAINSLDFKEKELQSVKAFSETDHFTSAHKKSRSTLNDMVRSPLFFVAVIAIVINFIFFYPLNKDNKETQKEEKIQKGVPADSLENEEETTLF